MHPFLARLLDMMESLQGRPSSATASLERAFAAAKRAHDLARRALAIAIAEEAREAERRTTLLAKVGDLETRAIEVIRAGRDDLALEIAQAIAAMSTDVNASEQAAGRFAAEAALARREVDAQRRRLSDLDRGRRLARIGTALNGVAPGSDSGLDSLTEAEAALAQVVAENHNSRFVREEMAPPAERLIERLSDAGFGEPLQVRAIDVLARLRGQAGLQQAGLQKAGLQQAGNKPAELIESIRDLQQRSNHVTASDPL
jgi:hypothetical protein